MTLWSSCPWCHVDVGATIRDDGGTELEAVFAKACCRWSWIRWPRMPFELLDTTSFSTGLHVTVCGQYSLTKHVLHSLLVPPTW